NGSAYIVKAAFITQVSSSDVVNLFNSVRDGEYQEFIEKCEDFFREIEKETKKENFTFVELEENEDEYNKLAEWLKKIVSRDFFQSPQKLEAEKNIELCKQLLDDFSNKVYGANEE
ncbi:MAG: Chromate resistance protein ChrB, partial [Dehalobacterium sp.]